MPQLNFLSFCVEFFLFISICVGIMLNFKGEIV
uniref:ATPase subunit 8 n=1 Tax=Polycarpa mytiligera TaxID=569436 RepID=S0DG79_POLMY|nr:ATP synthase F0 subunit 8 [Polycarpa mytiligera]CCO25747.1 ATPase subunit 8 [Polycarpa mytiligera]